jgi:hypothetical protein
LLKGGMSKVMIGIKVSEKFKALLEEQAKAENRTLSNFIKNALITYLEDNGLRYVEADDKVEKKKPKAKK